MRDVFKILLFFGAFIGVCAICEWLADNVPWVIWILLPVVIWIMYIAIFGNHFRKEDKE